MEGGTKVARSGVGPPSYTWPLRKFFQSLGIPSAAPQELGVDLLEQEGGEGEAFV